MENAIVNAIKENSRTIDSYLRCYYPPSLIGQQDLLGEWHECTSDIGLRLRPFLLHLSSRAGGIEFNDIVSIAAGIEMIQLSTLIIDDVLDESPLRNNKPSVFAQRGPEEAISIGTAFSSDGLSLIARSFSLNTALKNGLSVLKLMTDTISNIYVGQILDLRMEGNTSVDERDYLEMISKTTACFIQAPLVAGAMLWDAPSEILTRISSIGYSLGMAYQIRDDIIDVIGDSECTGKPIGGDLRQCKMRIPTIHALSELSGTKREWLISVLRKRRISDDVLDEAIRIILETNSIQYCIDKTNVFCQEVFESINHLPKDMAIFKRCIGDVANIISSFDN